MNAFQKIVHARIQALRLQADAASVTGHNGAIGSVREAYIRNFLQDITPAGVALVSGVMVNSADEPSPQIDVIAAWDAHVPRFALDENTAVVPIEAALMAIEIKSTLRKQDLDQVAKQNEWITNTKFIAPPSKELKVPTAIIAYDSSVSSDAVKEWMAERSSNMRGQNTSLCCVIGKFYLVQQGDMVVEHQCGDDFAGTMRFISDLSGGLEFLRQQRERALAPLFAHNPTTQYPHPLQAYLYGMTKPLEK